MKKKKPDRETKQLYLYIHHRTRTSTKVYVFGDHRSNIAHATVIVTANKKKTTRNKSNLSSIDVIFVSCSSAINNINEKKKKNRKKNKNAESRTTPNDFTKLFYSVTGRLSVVRTPNKRFYSRAVSQPASPIVRPL